jgi:hypothetical protein
MCFPVENDRYLEDILKFCKVEMEDRLKLRLVSSQFSRVLETSYGIWIDVDFIEVQKLSIYVMKNCLFGSGFYPGNSWIELFSPVAPASLNKVQNFSDHPQFEFLFRLVGPRRIEIGSLSMFNGWNVKIDFLQNLNVDRLETFSFGGIVPSAFAESFWKIIGTCKKLNCINFFNSKGRKIKMGSFLGDENEMILKAFENKKWKEIGLPFTKFTEWSLLNIFHNAFDSFGELEEFSMSGCSTFDFEAVI